MNTRLITRNARSTILYEPSGTVSPENVNDCGPALWSSSAKRVETVTPVASRRVAVTVAGTLSVYETVATSSTPSPLGLMTGGWTVTPVSFKAGGFPPIVPVAGRTVVPAEIAQKYLPRA